MVRKILRVVHSHSGDECFPQQFSLGGILKGYSDYTPGGIRGKQGFNSEELDVSQQTKSDQERKAFGVKSVYTPI